MLCTKVTLIELANYRQWTELLGSDREWKIQETQSLLYLESQRAAAPLGGLVIPLRYDYAILLSSGLSDDEINEVLDKVREASPVEVKAATAAAPTPAAAVTMAFNRLRGRGQAQVEGCSDEVTVIGHVDLDNVTGLTESSDPLEAFHSVEELLNNVIDISRSYGGIAQYLGGDNIMIVMPVSNFRELAERLASVDKVKVGVGVARTPRAAAQLATRSLDDIRSRRDRGPLMILSDLEERLSLADSGPRGQ